MRPGLSMTPVSVEIAVGHSLRVLSASLLFLAILRVVEIASTSATEPSSTSELDGGTSIRLSEKLSWRHGQPDKSREGELAWRTRKRTEQDESISHDMG